MARAFAAWAKIYEYCLRVRSVVVSTYKQRSRRAFRLTRCGLKASLLRDSSGKPHLET